MSKTNPMPLLARRVVGEQDPAKFSEILLSMLVTRPQQLGQLVKDVIVKGPERGTDARPGSPRCQRRAG